MRIHRVLAGFFVLIGLASAGDDPFEGVRQTILAEMDKGRLPSLAVAVARNGKIAWEEGFGWADLERHIPATHDTIYSLASVSKPMTATALMILVERGQIDLDGRINDYLGQVKLTDMRASRPKRPPGCSLLIPRVCRCITISFRETRLIFVPRWRKPSAATGSWSPSPQRNINIRTSGTAIAGYIIERVSGMRYEKFIKEEVFRPLGLSQTSVPTAPDSKRRWAVRYWNSETPLPFYDFDHRGASAVFSSVHDLIRFGLFHLKAGLPDQGAILTDRSIDQMKRPIAKRNVSRGLWYGLADLSGQEWAPDCLAHRIDGWRHGMADSSPTGEVSCRIAGKYPNRFRAAGWSPDTGGATARIWSARD